MTTFYLGLQEVCWLGRTSTPGFLSARRLARSAKTKLPRALGPWVLDSGGFTMLIDEGRYPEGWLGQLAELARLARHEIGNLQWVATPDWMCEPNVLARTGLTVEEHQIRTVDAACEARFCYPDIPWAPVIQGWTLEDYHRCVDLYAEAGWDLTKEPVVGLGTICRRQGTEEAVDICRQLEARGLSLHAFGLKTLGLKRLAGVITSADSMAWSKHARMNNIRLPTCRHRGDCRNCLAYAIHWHNQLRKERR